MTGSVRFLFAGLAVLVVFAAAGLGAPAVAAQEEVVEAPADSVPTAPPGVVVQPDPGGALVVATLRFPVGSALDPEGEGGTAFLLGRAIELEAERRLGPADGRVEARVGRAELLVTLLAPPERWTEAFGAVEGILGDLALPDAEIERLRDAHAETLLFQAGAPVRSFELERLRLLLGAGAGGTRPVAGTLESVRRIPADGPARFLASHLDREQATVAVVGPVAAEELDRVLPAPRLEVPGAAAGVRDGRGPGTGTGAPNASDGDGFEGPGAWSTPDRRTIDRELTSAWIAVAWPFPEGISRQLLRFTGGILRETTVPSPPDPGFYGAEVSVEETPGGPVLLFSVTVHPRMAARWEDRLLEALPRLAEAPPEGAVLDLGRRRYRNRSRLREGVPEERSRVLARELARTGAVPDLRAASRGWTLDALARTAGSAGPARVLVLGPIGMIEEAR